MANLYYNFSPAFVPGTKVRSDQVNNQYQALETAFDLLPADPNSAVLGTATLGVESGSGNAYAVTMPNTRLANAEGDEIQFRATHTNTGATTVDVDGIGAVPFVRFDGSAMLSGQIVTGRVYEARFDNTNTQFVLSQSTDGANQVLYAEEWAINPINVPVSVAAGGDGATTFSALHWANEAATATTGMVFLGEHDASTGAPTPAGAADDVYRISVAGSFDTVTYSVGDYTLFNGTTWQKLSTVSPATEVVFLGDHDATTGSPTPTVNQSDTYRISVAGTFDSVTYVVGDFTLYNGTNWIKSADNDTTGGGSPFTEVVITNTNAPDLVDTDVALNVGSATPAISQHVEVGPAQIQSKSTSTTASAVSINSLGGDVEIGAQSGTGAVNLFDDGISRLVTNSAGRIGIKGDGNLDTDIRRIDLTHQNGTVRAHFGHNTTIDLQVRNIIDSGNMILQATDTTSTLRTLVLGDPDGSTSLFHAGVERFLTDSTGRVIIRSETNTDTETRAIRLEHQNGTLRAFLGHSGSSLFIQNLIHGATVNITGEKGGGASSDMIICDPDGESQIYYNGTERLSTRQSGQIALISTGNTDTETRRIIFEHANGSFRGYMGYQLSGIFEIKNQIHGEGVSLIGEDAGGTARNLLVGDPDTDVKLYRAGIEVARTLPAASGGLEVNNALTGPGFERVLTTSDLTSITSASKSATTARTSTTTKTVDPDLSVSLTAGNWLVNWVLVWNETAGASQGLRFDWRATGGTVAAFDYVGSWGPAASTPTASEIFEGPSASNNNLVAGDSTNRRMYGSIEVRVTATTSVELFWAQVVSNANATNVILGSSMNAVQIS